MHRLLVVALLLVFALGCSSAAPPHGEESDGFEGNTECLNAPISSSTFSVPSCPEQENLNFEILAPGPRNDTKSTGYLVKYMGSESAPMTGLNRRALWIDDSQDAVINAAHYFYGTEERNLVFDTFVFVNETPVPYSITTSTEPISATPENFPADGDKQISQTIHHTKYTTQFLSIHISQEHLPTGTSRLNIVHLPVLDIQPGGTFIEPGFQFSALVHNSSVDTSRFEITPPRESEVWNEQDIKWQIATGGLLLSPSPRPDSLPIASVEDMDGSFDLDITCKLHQSECGPETILMFANNKPIGSFIVDPNSNFNSFPRYDGSPREYEGETWDLPIPPESLDQGLNRLVVVSAPTPHASQKAPSFFGRFSNSAWVRKD